jgi:hypothetical protein
MRNTADVIGGKQCRLIAVYPKLLILSSPFTTAMEEREKCYFLFCPGRHTRLIHKWNWDNSYEDRFGVVVRIVTRLLRIRLRVWFPHVANICRHHVHAHTWNLYMAPGVFYNNNNKFLHPHQLSSPNYLAHSWILLSLLSEMSMQHLRGWSERGMQL